VSFLEVVDKVGHNFDNREGAEDAEMVSEDGNFIARTAWPRGAFPLRPLLFDRFQPIP
jgi:hypothetical protein